jgi:hypothetical protein
MRSRLVSMVLEISCAEHDMKFHCAKHYDTLIHLEPRHEGGKSWDSLVENERILLLQLYERLKLREMASWVARIGVLDSQNWHLGLPELVSWIARIGVLVFPGMVS